MTGRHLSTDLREKEQSLSREEESTFGGDPKSHTPVADIN